MRKYSAHRLALSGQLRRPLCMSCRAATGLLLPLNSLRRTTRILVCGCSDKPARGARRREAEARTRRRRRPTERARRGGA